MDEIIRHSDFLILPESADLSQDLFAESDDLLNTLIELKGQCFYQLFKGKFIYLFYIQQSASIIN